MTGMVRNLVQNQKYMMVRLIEGVQSQSSYQGGGSDGTDIDYDNWNPGEPNDRDGQESCAELEVYDGKSDRGCMDLVYYIQGVSEKNDT